MAMALRALADDYDRRYSRHWNRRRKSRLMAVQTGISLRVVPA
jgi:hypothetical protein